MSTVDIKRLLYSFKKLQVSLSNIQESIRREQSKRLYPSCTAGYSDDIQGKGGLVSSQTERYAIFNLELGDKLERLQHNMSEHEYVISLIRTAVETLSERERELVRLTYFEGKTPTSTQIDMHLSQSHFYHILSTAMKGIEQCLNDGELYINHLIPMKKGKTQEISKSNRVKITV